MSYSDTDSSSCGGDHWNLTQITRERLLHEMLRSVNKRNSKSAWNQILIMDKLTVKIMACSCKMSDITQEGVSLVDDIYRRRQPLTTRDAIYFIQPTKENVIMFLSDMSGISPLYKKAFVFFSSPISRDLVTHIKKDSTVLPRIGALREMNLEYFAIDSQGFITDNERALEELFNNEENKRKADACLNVMAARIATVFASMREFPFVRYRAAKSLEDAMNMTPFRDLIPTKLAAGVWNHLVKYKQSVENFPQTETCELLILDRSIDQIAPVIHEWTYDAMCHDLLNMEGNKYVHEIQSTTDDIPEKKDIYLEEKDPLWLELRHAHIADVSDRLHQKMTGFISKNKAAQIHSKDGGEISTKELQMMVQALPQYSQQIDKLSLHVEIAGKIYRIIRELELRELGQLEQDLVFGDAGMQDVIKYLSAKENATRENKLRLLMILAAIYPEKFEGEKGLNLMTLAKLSHDDMTAINNMRLLGVSSDSKKSSSSPFTLKFDMKKKQAARKERNNGEETWQLSRFYPLIEELVENLCKRELSKEDYPCINDPSPTYHGSTTCSAAVHQASVAHSVRSRRTPAWAQPRCSKDEGYSSDSLLRHTSSDFKKMGPRIFVFIVGGATRSELRVCHKLTTKLNREVILGSSSFDDPLQFIKKLKLLTADELSLDDIQI